MFVLDCVNKKYFSETPKATVRCLPIEQGNEEFLFGGSVGAFFDMSSLHVIRCGITLTNIADVSTDELPATLEVLTSQPDRLTREDIDAATEVLLQIEEEPEQEVML